MSDEIQEQVEIARSDRNVPPKEHKLKWENGVCVCTSCDTKHTVSVDSSVLRRVIESN